MKRINYFLAAAMLSGATMVGFTSCDDDDDDSSSSQGTQQTSSVTKPVEGTDFTVAVDGTNVTVSTSLTYGNMYVLYDGVQTAVKDGKAVLNFPIAGDYKLTFNIYENGVNTASDEFTVKIEASDLSFLDKGVYKLLSGGQEAYEAASKTADANGVFTRTWRLDGFVNNSNVSYSKVFAGPGSFCLESGNACYNGGVTVNGSGAWRDLGALEDASISFDLVNKKVKVVFADGAKLQETTAPNAVNSLEALSGTFYGTFTYTEIEGNAEFLTAIDSWAGTSTDVAGLEIVLSGDNVRIPFLKQALAWPLSTKKDVTEFKMFASQSATDAEDGLMILSAVSYNTAAKDEANPDGEKILKDDYCNLMMTYIADELDNTYKYEVPAEEVAGQWVSHIAFWGNNNWDAEGIATVENVTVTGDGEYTYKATINAESTKAVYFCIHFDSPNSYAAFTADGVSVTVESFTINGEASTSAVNAETYELVGADGGTNNYRVQFLAGSDWAEYTDGVEFKQNDVIEIKIKVSGL